MASHFESATLWFALAGALSAGSAMLSGGGSSGSRGSSAGGATGPTIDSSNPANQPAQQPVQVINAQHLAQGGLISSPRMAVVGDVREAVLPLGRDSQALEEITDRLSERMGGGLTINVQGMVSADHLHRFVTKVNRDVKAGKVRVNSSNSYRLTRRG